MFAFCRQYGKMKVKAILKFYFTAEEAERRLDRLIYKKAFSVNAARGAYECAEEVAELVSKKGELCSLWSFLDGAVAKFSEGERETLRNYALSPRQKGERGREAHRLAVAFARRIRGGAQAYSEGLKVMAELCFIQPQNAN